MKTSKYFRIPSHFWHQLKKKRRWNYIVDCYSERQFQGGLTLRLDGLFATHIPIQQQVDRLACLPIWRAHKGVCRTGDGGRAKVCQFDLSGLRQQDVPSFNISERGEEGQHNAYQAQS